jgi:hypothetical protein
MARKSSTLNNWSIRYPQFALLVAMVMILAAACKKPFDAPAGALDSSILVVEGNIVAGDGAVTIFKLSRLAALQPGGTVNPEPNAALSIVSSNGNVWPLYPGAAGEYANTLSLPVTDSYKLVIKTQSGDDYETATQQPVITPAIDSITWLQPDELNLFVHTHNSNEASRYYKWEFEETWEYNSWFEATLKFANGRIVDRPVEEQVYTCYKRDSSKSILIANSAALAANAISYQPLLSISKLNSLDRNKLSVRYSILVKQLALSKAAYNFWNTLRKNTELTGTLFDPQPSKLPTNIICTSDGKKEVIGFVSVGTISEQRIFIKHSALNLWPSPNEADNCILDGKLVADAETFLQNDAFYLPVTYVPRTGNSLVFICSKGCVDCTLRGGVNIKPSFW